MTISPDASALERLTLRIDTMESELATLRSALAIANLQGRYIYYLQAHQYDKIAEMFARRHEVSVEMDNLGKFLGREKTIEVFMRVLKPLYTMKGSMGLHMLTTPVVEVHPGGQSAWGMWHTMGCNTQPDFIANDTENPGEMALRAMWQQGKYFIDFVQEDGEWKFQHFRWYVNFRTPFDEGWVKYPVMGSLQVVARHLQGSPEPDGPSEFHPFSPQELTPYLPVPPAGFSR